MSKAPDTWMPIYWGDYIKDTMHLTTEMHGAYLLLIAHYWTNGGEISSDDFFLKSVTKISSHKWKKFKPFISKFFIEKDGMWHHPRIDAELRKASENQEKRREKARKAANAKWGNDDAHSNAHSNATSMHGECSTDAPSPSPIKEKNIKKENQTEERNEFVPKTKLTQSFCPDQQSIEYAQSLNHDPSEQQRKFINHYTGNGQLRHDWQAVYRAWCDKAAEFSKSNSVANEGGYDPQTDPHSQWRGRLMAWKKSGTWADIWGPKPGEQHCEAPPHILEEFNQAAQ